MFKEFRQDTEFEMLGQFVYAGGIIDDGISGKIIYKKDGKFDKLELEIYGELIDPNIVNDSLDDFNMYHKIIGFTNNGFTVIIDRAVKRKSKRSYPGIPYTRYSLGSCLFLKINYDRNFDEVSNELSNIGIDNLEVTNCQYSFAGIDEWIDESKVVYSRKDRKCNYEVNLNKVREDVYLVKDENLKFSSGFVIKNENKGFYEEFYWGLGSINNQEIKIKTLINKLKIFKELLEIFITSPIDFSHLKFKIPVKQMDNKLVTGYLVKSGLNNGVYKKSSIDIPYNKVKENFGKILCNQYKKRNKLTLISQNFIINKYAHQYNQSVLLNSIKSLEIYHRNFIEQKKELDENLNRDKEIVLDFISKNIKDEHNRKKFERNIKFDSEMALNKRLKELFRGLDDSLLNKLVQNQSGCRSDRVGKFTHKLVNTRNYYTHGDPESLKSNVITDSVELIETTLLLNQVIKYYICRELFEIDDEIISIIVKSMNGVIK